MNSNHTTWLTIAIISLFITTSCKKNTNKTDENIKVKSLSEYLGKLIEVDIKGKVLDRNQKPIDSATIIVGDKTTLTDKDGNYILENTPTHENLLSVETNRNGYKNVLISLIPNKGINTVDIVLHKETELCLFWFCRDNHSL